MGLIIILCFMILFLFAYSFIKKHINKTNKNKGFPYSRKHRRRIQK